MASDKKVTLINNSSKTFHTAQGEFKPETSMEFSGKEAEAMLDYPGIVDAAKYVKPGSADEKLRQENDKLKAEIVELKEKIAELEKKPGKK